MVKSVWFGKNGKQQLALWLLTFNILNMASESELSFFTENDNANTNVNSYSFQSSREQSKSSRGQNRTSTLPDWDDVGMQSKYDYSQVMSGFSSPSVSPLQPASTSLTRRGEGGGILSTDVPYSNSKVSLASLAAEVFDSTDDDFKYNNNNNDINNDNNNTTHNSHNSSDVEGDYRARSPHYYGGDRAFWEHHRSGFKTVAERERDEINEGRNLSKSINVETSYDVRKLLDRHDKMFQSDQRREQSIQNSEPRTFMIGLNDKNNVSSDNLIENSRMKNGKIENVTFKPFNHNEVEEDDVKENLKPASKNEPIKSILNNNNPNNNSSSHINSDYSSEGGSTKGIVEIRKEIQRGKDIENEKFETARICFDRSREMIATSIHNVSLSSACIVKENIEAYCEWMTVHLANATKALESLTRDSVFSLDENQWGGDFSTAVSASSVHNPSASAWLKDLGQGFLHPQCNRGQGIKFEGTCLPLIPSDGAGAGQFGAWGVSPPPVITREEGRKFMEHGTDFPLPSIEAFPHDSTSSSAIAIEWCSSHIITLLNSLKLTAVQESQLKFIEESRHCLEKLCESIGNLTIACGAVVERLQNRDKHRKKHLFENIQKMELCQKQTIRHVIQEEKNNYQNKLQNFEKEILLKNDEKYKQLEMKLKESEEKISKIEVEKQKLKTLVLKEREENEIEKKKLIANNNNKINEIEKAHENEIKDLRIKCEESFKNIQVSKNKECEDIKILLERQQAESRVENERVINMWKEKSNNSELRVREALKGRAEAETRARDVLDREIRRLREMHSEQMKQFSSQVELQERKHETELANQRTSFLLRERELLSKNDEFNEISKLKQEEFKKKLNQSMKASEVAIERRIKNEYDDLIRVLKTTHEGELRHIGVEVMRLRREVQRTSKEGLLHLPSSSLPSSSLSSSHQSSHLFRGLDSSGQDLNMDPSQDFTHTPPATRTPPPPPPPPPPSPPPTSNVSDGDRRSREGTRVGLPPRPMAASPARGVSTQKDSQSKGRGKYGAALDDYIQSNSPDNRN